MDSHGFFEDGKHIWKALNTVDIDLLVTLKSRADLGLQLGEDIRVGAEKVCCRSERGCGRLRASCS